MRTGEQWMRVPMLVSLQARSVPRLMLLEGWPREAEAGGGKEPWRRRVQHESQQEEALLRFVAPWWSDHALLGDTAGRQPAAAAAAAAAHGQAALSQVPRRLCELAASVCVCVFCVFCVCVCVLCVPGLLVPRVSVCPGPALRASCRYFERLDKMHEHVRCIRSTPDPSHVGAC